MTKIFSISVTLFFIISFPILLTGQQLDSIKVDIVNPGSSINSAWADFSPVISADGSTMMFTSRRPVTEKELKSGKTAFERIFVTYYHASDTTWSKAVPLESSVNAMGRNNSAIALSSNGQQLLLFRDDAKGNGDIYQSSLKGNTWSEAEKLPEPINSQYHESSASWSPEGNTIYFVSNRKGGTGGRDIWSCTKDKTGQWGIAQPLSAVINTNDDEEGVYLHPDGKTLYFSSKSHNSLGGYDVFKSINNNGQWSTPENIGKPINSTMNDVFFVMEANGKKGNFSSTAKGGLGEEDIYMASFTVIEKAKGPRLTLLKGIIYDEVTNAPLEAEIILTDNVSGEQIASSSSNSTTGKYLVSLPAGKNYGISVTAKEYLFHSVNVFMADTADYSEVEKNIGLKKLVVGSKIVLNNIFYDFDAATLRNESISELDRLYNLMISNPSMKLEILSHTDAMGSDEYNQKLSQERAQSVVDYLKGRGIEKDRLQAKGYGKTNPVATNETEEGRQMNRRTEFSILSK